MAKKIFLGDPASLARIVLFYSTVELELIIDSHPTRVGWKNEKEEKKMKSWREGLEWNMANSLKQMTRSKNRGISRKKNYISSFKK